MLLFWERKKVILEVYIKLINREILYSFFVVIKEMYF